jgi:hypothetical protein
MGITAKELASICRDLQGLAEEKYQWSAGATESAVCKVKCEIFEELARKLDEYIPQRDDNNG